MQQQENEGRLTRYYKGRPCGLGDIVMEIERWEQWRVESDGKNAGQPTHVIIDDPTSTYYRCSDCLHTFTTWDEASTHLPNQVAAAGAGNSI